MTSSTDMFDDTCLLCRKEKLTKWFYEDSVCWVAICITCGRPMVVLDHHGEPTEAELEHIKQVSKKVFPDKQFRGYRRRIFDHYHEHLITPR